MFLCSSVSFVVNSKDFGGHSNVFGVHFHKLSKSFHKSYGTVGNVALPLHLNSNRITCNRNKNGHSVVKLEKKADAACRFQ